MKLAAVNVVPVPISTFPPIVSPVTAVVEAVPERVKSPLIEMVPIKRLFMPEFDRVKLQ